MAQKTEQPLSRIIVKRIGVSVFVTLTLLLCIGLVFIQRLKHERAEAMISLSLQGVYSIATLDGNMQEVEKNFTLDEMRQIMLYRSVGQMGSLFLCNEDGQIVGGAFIESNEDARAIDGSALNLNSPQSLKSLAERGGIVEEDIWGTSCYVGARKVQEWYIVAICPVEELDYISQYLQGFLFVDNFIVFVILLIVLGRVMRSHFTNKVVEINNGLAAIAAGDLKRRLNVRGSKEFCQISHSVNVSVDKVEELIEKESKRLEEELHTARMIQHTALPNVFPPFPNRDDVGLFASMDPAREVGGDFYDFFLLSGTKLAVVMADVSDKGIPAAMFMMRAKTALKAHAMSGLAVDEVVRRTNMELCEDNEAHMFVTVWMGVLDLATGLMEYVHAGHTCPVLVHDGTVSWVKKKRNFFVGGMPQTKYARQELQLDPGDLLYLYTDGVTEAFDANEEVYGNKRLERVMGEVVTSLDEDDLNERCRTVCTTIRNDVAQYSAGTEQSDDITMLCLALA